MKQLYLCRHGQTEWTLSGQHTGTTDVPLTKQGCEEATLLRKEIQSVLFDAIFCSPKKRTIDTCGNLIHQIDPNISEWNYGDYEGITTDEIHKSRPNWNLFKDGAPNGETPEQVGKRADLFLEKVRQFPGNVAVFSHGHFLRVLAVRYLGLPVEMGRFLFVSGGSLGILGTEHDLPVIVLWNQLPSA